MCQLEFLQKKKARVCSIGDSKRAFTLFMAVFNLNHQKSLEGQYGDFSSLTCLIKILSN